MVWLRHEGFTAAVVTARSATMSSCLSAPTNSKPLSKLLIASA
jgi:hypothetical protein